MALNKCACALALLFSVSSAASAINIRIDYSFDSSNFFGAGNPQGATAGNQARLAIEAAAGYYSDILTDTLSPIVTPAPFLSSNGQGHVEWGWTQSFFHPHTGNLVQLTNQTVAANEYVIYVGAKGLASLELGRAGPGGYDPQLFVINSNFASQAEVNQVNQTTSDFQLALNHRGDATGGFSSWGGWVTFDNDGSTNWHFSHTAALPAGKIDFMSVALHELAHTLGFGVNYAAGPPSEWQQLTSGANFIGAAAQAEFGGPVPLDQANEHWANGTMSTVLGGFHTQETVMDPDIGAGVRKAFTALDAAALTDIGWQVVPPAALPGDYNGDGNVNTADYIVWRNALGTPQQVGSFAEWKANFGATTTSIATSAVSTPEPSAIGQAFTFLLVVGAWPTLRRRSGC